MYEYLFGKLVKILPTYIILEVGGIGYKINCPNPYVYQERISENIKCYVELVVREDSMTLFGFDSENEKNLFLTLNKVSGIGPKSALSILAAGDNEGLVKAIDSGDSTYLTKFPGVGKKTAQQMLLDLGGKLTLPNSDSMIVDNKLSNSIYDETCEALEGLGYSTREITRISKELKNRTFSNTQDALSFAFKLLLKA